MTPTYIRTLFTYNRWANHRVLDSLGAVDEEKLHRDLGSSFPSIRDTLVHVLASEWVWYNRWIGTSPASFPDTDDLTGVDVIRSRWTAIGNDVKTFVDGLTPERLEAPITYKNTRGEPFTQPLWQQMCHVVNHSTYHRGQIATMMRQVNEVPISTDMIVFFRT